MNSQTIDKIKDQALQEIAFARTFKQPKVPNWGINEQMYYAKAIKASESRSSVQLSRMQEFVHTLLSKIDNPLVFKMTKRKNAQTERVALLNALRGIDQKRDQWDLKDIVGKKQCIIYGRPFFSYYADSINGKYRPHLNNVDVYNMLVDPACGGIDLEDARNLGDYSVVLDKKGIAEGIKNRNFIKANAKILLDGTGNASQMTVERTNTIARTQDQNTINRREGGLSSDKWRFWRWYTTYEGDRYYLLMSNSGDVLRCEYLPDILPVSSDFPDGAWPYWTYAAFPDLTELWTPSYCDYVREIFMAQDVTVNQMMDNAEAINKPQKIVNITAIENLAELKYRRDGIIKVKGDVDANKAIQFVTTPSIDTPLKVYELLEGIHSKATGVNDAAKGVSDVEGKVGIYRGNEAATADRFGLLNKSYSFGYERFARLWQMGVQDNLVKKEAVELIGPNGVEMREIKRSDVFKKGDVYGVMTEASNAEMLASEQSRAAKSAFLVAQALNPAVNKKKSFEIQAEIVGLSQDQIDQLLDVSTFGNAKLMGECDRDIESLLFGEEIKPNAAANNAYKQRMVNYLQDHEEDISMPQFEAISAYIVSLEDIILRNEARALQTEETNRMRAMSSVPVAPGGMPPAGSPGVPPPNAPVPALA